MPEIAGDSMADPQAVIAALKDAPKKKRWLEEDAKLLQNRIRHLQLELGKTKKKVVETTSRSKQLKSMQSSLHKRKEERVRGRQASLGQTSERHEHLKRQQEGARRKVKEARQAKEDVARRDAELLRHQRDEMKLQKQSIKEKEAEETRRRVQERKAAVLTRKRQDQEAGRRKEEERLEVAKEELRQHRASNGHLAAQVGILEEQELEGIDKLKRALEDQHNIFAQLEDELGKDATIAGAPLKRSSAS